MNFTNNPTSGIVGLANVGKSTFFQTLTNSRLGTAANYPFATIDPEVSKVPIPAPQLGVLQRLYGSQKCVPAALTVYDIAGLTRGASRGQGLGNKFLNDIRHVDGVFNLVRGFRDDSITHIEGTVDPVRDLSVVQDELILKDLEFIETVRDKSTRRLRMVPKNTKEHKELSYEIDMLNRLEEHLYEGKKIRHFKEDWTLDDVRVLKRNNFLTAKPSLTLLNVSPEEYISFNKTKDIDSINRAKEVKEWLKEYSPNEELMLFSAEFEKNYLEFMKENKRDELVRYCERLTTSTVTDNLIASALAEIILKMKTLLGLISFFTCGPLEVRQWNISKGSTAPEAAGVIHTDLQDTFISADIIKYDSIKDMPPPITEAILKKASVIKRAGKSYIMEENDIALFKAASGKGR